MIKENIIRIIFLVIFLAIFVGLILLGFFYGEPKEAVALCIVIYEIPIILVILRLVYDIAQNCNSINNDIKTHESSINNSSMRQPKPEDYGLTEVLVKQLQDPENKVAEEIYTNKCKELEAKKAAKRPARLSVNAAVSILLAVVSYFVINYYVENIASIDVWLAFNKYSILPIATIVIALLLFGLLCIINPINGRDRIEDIPKPANYNEKHRRKMEHYLGDLKKYNDEIARRQEEEERRRKEAEERQRQMDEYYKQYPSLRQYRDNIQSIRGEVQDKSIYFKYLYDSQMQGMGIVKITERGTYLMSDSESFTTGYVFTLPVHRYSQQYKIVYENEDDGRASVVFIAHSLETYFHYIASLKKYMEGHTRNKRDKLRTTHSIDIFTTRNVQHNEYESWRDRL